MYTSPCFSKERQNTVYLAIPGTDLASARNLELHCRLSLRPPPAPPGRAPAAGLQIRGSTQRASHKPHNLSRVNYELRVTPITTRQRTALGAPKRPGTLPRSRGARAQLRAPTSGGGRGARGAPPCGGGTRGGAGREGEGRDRGVRAGLAALPPGCASPAGVPRVFTGRKTQVRLGLQLGKTCFRAHKLECHLEMS